MEVDRVGQQEMMTYTQAARSTEEFHMVCRLGQGLVLRICSLLACCVMVFWMMTSHRMMDLGPVSNLLTCADRSSTVQHSTPVRFVSRVHSDLS